MLYFDPLYLLFLLPALIFSGAASLLLRYWNNKYSQVANRRGITGLAAGSQIAQSQALKVSFAQIDSELGDNYDPRSALVSLSPGVAGVPSIAAVAIASHELGHVQQHQQGSLLFSARSLILPVINIGSSLGYGLIIIGFLLSFSNLAWVGLLLFSFSAVFSLLTLPIEIDASIKGLANIRRLGLLDASEQSGATKVLIGAALTYVAALAAALMNVAYYALRIGGISRRGD